MELDHQVADRIRDCLVQLFDPAKVIIFGSFGRGEAREDSDIDIAVIREADQPVDIDTIARGRLAIRKVLKGTGLPLDLIMQSREMYDAEKVRVGSACHTIETEGLVLYERH